MVYWILAVIVLYTGTTTSVPVTGELVARKDIFFSTQQACIDAGNAIVAASQANVAGAKHVTVMPACFSYP